MTDYESVRQQIENAPSAASESTREVTWLTDAHVVGVARDQDGRVEVFLSGAELSPISTQVAEAVEFHNWHREVGRPFQANRILLPGMEHFDQVAAFICTELLRSGADVSLGRAFAKTEPIIGLAIERLRLSNQAILGLAGELLLLDALCRNVTDSAVSATVDSWTGWKRSSRDFLLGATGIEVKTTTGRTSSHLVEGVHQVEPSEGSNGRPSEDRFYLVSVGLQPGPSGGNAFSVPQLVDRIIARLAATGGGAATGRFIGHVSEYGAATGSGYDHTKQGSDPVYATAFNPTFFRAYDMSGDAINVLRRRDITLRSHVDVSSVRFRVDLPVVAGPANPVNGANQVARAILNSAAGQGDPEASAGGQTC